MASKIIVSLSVITFLAAGPAHPGEVAPGSAGLDVPSIGMGATETGQPLARTDFGVEIGRSVLDSQSLQVDRKLLAAIIGWLSHHFGLPHTDKLPKIDLVQRDVIQSLLKRYHSGAHLDIEALYLTTDQTIYLPLGWTGSTPRELSILVHELVHYLQHLSGMKFACAEELEKLAYKAQRAWLALFDRDLFEEFDTDPFTVLVRTQCPM
jgi:hypothetical protein